MRRWLTMQLALYKTDASTLILETLAGELPPSAVLALID
jgi:hypothetical protein